MGAGKLRSLLKTVALLSLPALLAGCGNLHYLIQAGKGQMELINRARPISEVLRDERTPPRTRSLLGEISSVKKYGEENGLKPTSNYTEYVKLNRSAAVWVVSASETLRFKAKDWSFPIVGSFPYLGWFDANDAKEFASGLKKEGWDVDVRRASAYSTLGWFRDAVLSTMIPEGPEALGDLVNVVLHESVHATLYIKGQSFFNESLANFMANQLTLTYLDKIKGPHSPERQAYLDSQAYGDKIEKRFHDSYVILAGLYSSSKPDSEKIQEKEKILSALASELGFKREINNATLIQFKTYNTGQEDFESLFKRCGSSWPKFLTALKTLTPSSFGKPQQDEVGTTLSSLQCQGS